MQAQQLFGALEVVADLLFCEAPHAGHLVTCKHAFFSLAASVAMLKPKRLDSWAWATC